MFNLLSANILAKAGNGGDGSKAANIHFRSYIYHGGDGGAGGNVAFCYSDNLLINNRFKLNNIIAQDGQRGKPGKKDGKNAPNLIVPVSCHTLIKNSEDELLATITFDNKFYILKGGAGGLGSRSAKSAQFTKQTCGQKTEKIQLKLSVILPVGDICIFNISDLEKIRTIIKEKWNYTSHGKEEIICLNDKNNYKYLIPYCNNKTIETIQHISKVKSVSIYTDSSETNNKYFLHFTEIYPNIEIISL